MFGGLKKKIYKLNADISDVDRTSKAKKLKRKLLIFGLLMMIVGFGGVVACFIYMITNITNLTRSNLFSYAIIYLYIPLLALGAVGVSITKLAFKVDTSESIRPFCLNCRTPVEGNEKYCMNCGTRLNSKCPKCGTFNDGKRDTCRNCNERLF